MVGSEVDAGVAREIGKPIGAGFSRECFLHNDIVYKYGLFSSSFNREEKENIDRLSSLPDKPRNLEFPNCELHILPSGEFVMAMEYISGKTTGIECEEGCPKCMPVEICSWLTSHNIMDFGWGNVILSNEVFYLIDVTH